jgi:hypothetical protein
MIDDLKARLAAASAELRTVLHSWEYAFAMGAGCHAGTGHPRHVETRARAASLERTCADLRARLAELQVD